MRVDVDRERCIGAGMCALAAPDVFDQDDDDGTVVLLAPTPAPRTAEVIRRAVLLCPSGAIAVRPGDDVTGVPEHP
jgi:ferredoxin